MRGKMGVVTKRMLKTHTKGTPGRSYGIDDLIEGDPVKKDGNFI